MKDKIQIVVIVSAIIFIGWGYVTRWPATLKQNVATVASDSLEKTVLPETGITLPVRWGDLGAKMVESGVIDADKFESLYAGRAASSEASLALGGRGGLDKETKTLLVGGNNGNLKITRQNAGTILNLLWALGLGNKNPILENGPMVKYNGDASGFASTGGWTLARGNVMNHYSRHAFLNLTSEQQALVERVSKNIYRPCCDNPTYFPDCNHGMAMLGLLELLAAQGVTEDDMYKVALQVNSYWFSDTYLTLAKYFQTKGIGWDKVNPQEVLGRDYSSASGYQRILQQVTPVNNRGASCGV